MSRFFAAAFAAATLAAPTAALRRGGGGASAELEASLAGTAASEQRGGGNGGSIGDQEASAAFAAMWADDDDDDDDEDDDAAASSEVPDDSSLSSSKTSRAAREREEHPRRGAGAASIGAALASARRSAPVVLEKAKAHATSDGHHRKGHHHHHHRSRSSSSSSSPRPAPVQTMPPQAAASAQANTAVAAATAAAAAAFPPLAGSESSRREAASKAVRELAEKEEKERDDKKASSWLIYAGLESYIPSRPTFRDEAPEAEPLPSPSSAKGSSSWDSVLRFATEAYIDPTKMYCQDKQPYTYKATRLLVFDFDETLTISTWGPDEEDFPEFYTDASLSKDELVERIGAKFSTGLVMRCFSPARLEVLRELLREVAADPEQRTLAILTRNRGGAIGVLNTLKLADLDQYFQVIWAFPARGGSLGSKERGVIRTQKVEGADGGAEAEADAGAAADIGKAQWSRFIPGEPIWTSIRTKDNVLRHVTMYPERWLPTFDKHEGPLAGLSFEEVVLIDDNEVELEGMDRFCKVPRVTPPGGNPKRDFSGGIGAHHDEDFHTLRAFLSFLEEKAERPVVYSPLLVARSVVR